MEQGQWSSGGAGLSRPVSSSVGSFFFLVQTLASWQSPLTRWDSGDLSESGIRTVQCYDCPTAQCSSGHGTLVGQAKSETRRCSGNCHARRHPRVLREHVKHCGLGRASGLHCTAPAVVLKPPVPVLRWETPQWARGGLYLGHTPPFKGRMGGHKGSGVLHRPPSPEPHGEQLDVLMRARTGPAVDRDALEWGVGGTPPPPPILVPQPMVQLLSS